MNTIPDHRLAGVLAVAAILFGATGSAEVQASPDAASAPEPSSSEAHDGIWLTLGENTWANDGSVTGLRLEAGFPVKTLGDGILSVMLPIVYAPSGSSALRVHEINVVPGVRFEWPVLDRWGTLYVWGDLGYGVHIATSEATDAELWGALRVASGATYVFPFGLLLTVQPLGLMATLIGETDGSASYEFAFVAGYRF